MPHGPSYRAPPRSYCKYVRSGQIWEDDLAALVVDRLGGGPRVKNLLPFPYTAILEQLRQTQTLAIGRE